MKKLVKLASELIAMLETVEESDSGNEFHPTTIQSCRCTHVERLSKIIPEIKRLCESYEKTKSRKSKGH